MADRSVPISRTLPASLFGSSLRVSQFSVEARPPPQNELTTIQGEREMLNFNPEINSSVWGGLHALNFKSTNDLLRWLDAEEPFWKEANAPQGMNQHLLNKWNQQRSFFAGVRTQLQNYISAQTAGNQRDVAAAQQAITAQFQAVSNGTVITSDYPIYPVIVDVAKKKNLEGAALLLAQARSDSQQQLGVFSNGIPVKVLLTLVTQLSRSEGSDDWLGPQRNELNALKGDMQAELDSLRTEHGEQTSAIAKQRKAESEALTERSGAFSQFMDSVTKDWDKQKKVYDEQLALLAPTHYWASRAQTHFWVAVVFAIAFAISLATSIFLFVYFAMPHLADLSKEKEISPLLALIPVAVPAFASIWILRMLSRLLSENLQMMRDARERETMVKTFLAMMRDDTTGKSLVNDDDRKLILQALFRASKIAGNDDAPPVNVLEVVNKVFGKT